MENEKIKALVKEAIHDEIEEQYQNEKKAIQQELEIELKSGYYTQRANELYNELRSLRAWYKKERDRKVN